MKKIIKHFGVFAILFISITYTFSQIPSGFNYQAVVRNHDGTINKNKSIEVRFTILNSGGVVFTDSYGVNTNDYGLFNVIVGNESDDFSNIDWSSAPYSLKIEINIVEMGLKKLELQ